MHPALEEKLFTLETQDLQKALVKLAENADLLIHEATFEDAMKERAIGGWAFNSEHGCRNSEKCGGEATGFDSHQRQIQRREQATAAGKTDFR